MITGGIQYVEQGKCNEKKKTPYALILAAVAVFAVADSGAVVLCEPHRREYCANFSTSFHFDPVSNSGRTWPSGTNLKPDIYIRQSRLGPMPLPSPPKHWSTAFSIAKTREEVMQGGYTATFNHNVLPRVTVVLQDQYQLPQWPRRRLSACLHHDDAVHLRPFRRRRVDARSTLLSCRAKFLRLWRVGLLVLDDSQLGCRSPDNPASFTIAS
jgi:hypothetical protein